MGWDNTKHYKNPTYKFDEKIHEREERVENDKYIRIRNTDNRNEFNQASRKGNIRAISDA